MADPRTIIRAILNDARKGADASVIARRTGLRPEQVVEICRRRRVSVARRHRHRPDDSVISFKLPRGATDAEVNRLTADHINLVWGAKGWDANARAELVDGHWCVRSDTIGGRPYRRLDTTDDAPQRDAERRGPVDAFGAGRVMRHDLSVAEINQPVTRKSGESFQ